MLFNSLHFLLFFPLVVAAYFGLPHRFRWMLLLAASYYFYMCWNPVYAILILTTTAIAYWSGLKMAQTEDLRRKKLYVTLSLVVSLGILFVFKYLNFTMTAVSDACNILQIDFQTPTFKLLLPVGISFYTFQTLSYSIDVYRGKKSVEKHFGIFAVYVSFFPQLVAGPIERSTNLLPQFFEKHSFDYVRMCDGLKLMLWGFFKKLVIADRLSVYVNEVYNNPGDYTGWPVLLATYFFAFQIYCDFSAYSDIAIGSAQVMGFRLMDNFNRPYFSKSISEFWRRWHISLSTWFKDYLYIPLGGNRCSKQRWMANLLFVFVVSGLWHGAAWTFIIWGALHGLYLMLEVLLKPAWSAVSTRTGLNRHKRILKFLQVAGTFHLVLFSWVFFRANSLSDAMTLLSQMSTLKLSVLVSPLSFLRNTLAPVALGTTGLLIAFASIGFMEFIHFLQRHWRMRHMLSTKPLWVRWAIYYAMLFGIIMFGVFSNEQFIYFQF